MAILIKSPELPFAGGTVTWWEKETGESVQFGDVLVEIRGSGGEDYPVKAILPGTVLHVFAKAGTEVPPDAPLAIVGEPGEDIGPWLNLAQSVPQQTAMPATQSGFTVATGGETAGSSFTVAADARTNFGNVANDAANMDSGGSSFTSATEVGPQSFVASGNLTTEQAQNLKTYGRGFDKFVKMRPVPQQGAMGELFFATQVLSGRDVVVKRLKPERRADTKSREYFMREINLGTVLPYHRNIINIFYSDENEHGPYYVMERVNGQSLQHFIDNQPIPANRLRDVFLGILDGLRHIHTHLMVHRDLKPTNILLDTQHWIPKIIDFGFAKHPSYPDIDVTDIGTGGYMAPEQRGDQQDVDARADIYAVGCVFYAMITREHPQTIDVSKITEPLQAVIARCAQSNPADRFQSVQEIMDALMQKTQGSGFSTKKTENTDKKPVFAEKTPADTSETRTANAQLENFKALINEWALEALPGNQPLSKLTLRLLQKQAKAAGLDTQKLEAELNDFIDFYREIQKTGTVSAFAKRGLMLQGSALYITEETIDKLIRNSEFRTQGETPNAGSRTSDLKETPESPVSPAILSDQNSFQKKTETYFFSEEQTSQIFSPPLSGEAGRGPFFVRSAGLFEEFEADKITTTRQPDSLYEIHVSNADNATFVIADNPAAQDEALKNKRFFLHPACVLVEVEPVLNQKITTLEPGKLRKSGSNWKIVQKAKIRIG